MPKTEAKSEYEYATAEELTQREPREIDIAITISDEQEKLVRVRQIKRSIFEKLVAEHTPEPTEEIPNPLENPETLGPVLFSECAINPTISLSLAEEIWAGWTTAEINHVYTILIGINTGNRVRIYLKESSGTADSR